MPIFGPYAPQAPLDFLGLQQQPQIDTLALIEKARRKKEEEEEERKRKDREYLDSIMQLQQQPPKPVEVDEPAMLKQLMDQRFTPERQARLQRMREEDPEQIRQRLVGNFYGNPTSTLGKIGTAALKIALGAGGVKTPDFNQLAMQQWIQQNKIANEEESSEARLAQEQLKGAVQQQRTAQMAQTAQERNKTMMGMKLIDAQIKEAQLEQQKLIDGYKAAGMDADTALKRAKLETEQRLQQTLGAAFPLLGVRDAAQAAALAKQMAQNPNLTPAQRAEIETYGGNLLKFTEGLEQSKNYRPGIADRMVNVPTPTLRTDPGTGNVVEIMQNKQRIIPGKPQQGMPNAASQAYLQGTSSSLVPQLPQNPQQQTAPVPQTRPMAASPIATQSLQPVSTEALPPGVPAGAREITPEIRAVGAKSSPNRYRSFFHSPNKVVLQSPGNKDVTRDDKANQSSLALSALSNSTIRDAYLSGDLDTISSMGRAALTSMGPDSMAARLASTIYKTKGDTQQIETAISRLTIEETANYLKKMSGAQVSDAEFQRLRSMFPQTGNLPDNNLQLAYWNTLVPTIMLQLDQAGVVTPQTVSKLLDVVGKVAKKYTENYLLAMKDIKAKKNSKEARERYNLDAFTNFDDIATQILQEAFPDGIGKTIPIQHNDLRFGSGTSYIYIPDSSVRAQDREDERKKKLEAARKAGLVKK